MKTISQMKPTQGARFTSPAIREGFNILLAREAARLSLSDVATASGVPLPTLSRIERGHLPDLVNALRIAAFYEKKVEEIWQLK